MNRRLSPRQILQRAEGLLVEHSTDAASLYVALSNMVQLYRDQCERLERVSQVADGYQAAVRDDAKMKIQSHKRRMERLAHISDGYHDLVHELNLSLSTAVMEDPLTGLANRRRIDVALSEEVSRARRTGRAFSLILLDIDHFKYVNDTYGHPTGDLVLKEVASALIQCVRDYDICSRWGGEEFLVLLPESSLDDTRIIVDRIQAAIRAIEISHGQATIRITASFGVAFHVLGEDHPDTLLRADQALMEGKSSGRNCIVFQS